MIVTVRTGGPRFWAAMTSSVAMLVDVPSQLSQSTSLSIFHLYKGVLSAALNRWDPCSESRAACTLLFKWSGAVVGMSVPSEDSFDTVQFVDVGYVKGRTGMKVKNHCGDKVLRRVRGEVAVHDRRQEKPKARRAKD